MIKNSSIVFHVHLVQDVSVLRPLIKLARTKLDKDIYILVSAEFKTLDKNGTWENQLDLLGQEFSAPIFYYADDLDAYQFLSRLAGIIVAGSESTVPNHAVTHRLFKAAPSRFTKITLQHGLECVGFLHNKAHDASAGRIVRFAADVVVGWFSAERLTSMWPSELPKLYVAGPPSLLEPPVAMSPRRIYSAGMICENLHSVRFGTDAARHSFLDEFRAFAWRMDQLGERVYFRSHPAGQYTRSRQLAFSRNVVESTEPIYDLALPDFRYAVSAPSSVLLDFMVAGVPVAVWQNPGGGLDLRNYGGLHVVASGHDCWRFVIDVGRQPQKYLGRQTSYLRDLRIPVNVQERYLALLASF